MTFTTLSLLTSSTASMAENFETVSGADRSFTYGYSQAQNVQRFEETILDRNAGEAAEQEALVSKPLEEEKLRVYRSFRVATLYDSNVFYAHNDPKDDLLYLYTPSIGFGLGKKGITRGFLNTFYDLTYVNYSENSKLSRFNQAHTVEMGFRGAKWNLTIANKFVPASARETGERTELASSTGARVIAYSDDAAVNLTYHWTPKVDLSGEYRYHIIYFPASSNMNNRSVTRFSFQENGITSRISYRLNSKNTLYLSGNVSSSDYFKNGNLASKYYLLSVGISHRLTPKTDVNLEVGYDRRDYNLPAFPSSEGPRFSGIIRHQFSTKWAAILSASRSTGEAFDFVEAASETTSFKTLSSNYRGDVEWKMARRMTLDAFVSAQMDSRDGFFTFTDPENPSQSSTQTLEDQIYSWGVHWGFQPRNAWTYYLSYEFLNKFSSFKRNQYDDQRVAGSARVNF